MKINIYNLFITGLLAGLSAEANMIELPKQWLSNSSADSASTAPLGSSPINQAPTLNKSLVPAPQTPHKLDQISEQQLAQAGESYRRALDVLGRGFDTASIQNEAQQARRWNSFLNNPPKDRPKDWVPWHLHYIATDFALLATGRMGVLFYEAVPAVSVFWRRRNPPAAKDYAASTPMANALEAAQPVAPVGDDRNAGNVPGLALSGSTTDQEIAQSIEPFVEAAYRSGQITRPARAKKTLFTAARSLRDFAAAIEFEDAHGTRWWNSGYRTDIALNAFGRSVPLPLASVGGQIRFRLEWRRMMRKDAPPGPRRKPPTGKLNPFYKGVAKLVQVLEDELERSPIGSGSYRPFSARIGIGVSARGDIGLARVSAVAVGHLNFFANVEPPPFRDDQLTVAMLANGASGAAPLSETMTTRTLDPDPIVFVDSSERVFGVPRLKFREQMEKANRIGSFFAGQTFQAGSRAWRPYEIGIGFDFSIFGDIGIVRLEAFPTMEISYWNQDFMK